MAYRVAGGRIVPANRSTASTPKGGPVGVRRTSGISGDVWWHTRNLVEAERIQQKLMQYGITSRLQKDFAGGSDGFTDYYVKVSATEVMKYLENTFLP